MKTEMGNPFGNGNCFFCGSNNDAGLKLTFFRDTETDEISCEYDPEERFSGQGSILHGAIQMGLLDEIMGWTSHAVTGEMAVTAGIDIRFRRPVYIHGGPVRVTGRVTSREGARVHMTAELRNRDGKVCTTAQGTYHILPGDRYAPLIRGGEISRQ